MDSLQLIDLSKEDDCLLPLSLRDSVEDVKLSCAVGFDNASMIKRGKMRPVEERRPSELRKSLDWNSDFFTSQGSTLSSRSQGDFSSRLTSFTTLKTKMSKVHRLNESTSGASSKCTKRCMPKGHNVTGRVAAKLWATFFGESCPSVYVRRLDWDSALHHRSASRELLQ
ncbi:hypothetical protein Tco_1071093 [Tanacetum coccineum]|uniref:Uncharacterized protein n=1 Tax=Tanacetum coccineum TaxID=301880 RepID=A0ABQ5HNB7_9ASTR